jgi:hypothetical protein
MRRAHSLLSGRQVLLEVVEDRVGGRDAKPQVPGLVRHVVGVAVLDRLEVLPQGVALGLALVRGPRVAVDAEAASRAR